MKYRSKPVEIEAMQWTGDNAEELLKWADGSIRRHRAINSLALENGDFVSYGDYVVKSGMEKKRSDYEVEYEEDFKMKYEKVGE